MPPKSKKTTEKPAAADTAVPPKPKKRTKSEAADSALPAKKESSTMNRRQSTGPVVTEDTAFEGTTAFERLTKDDDFDPRKMLRIISWNVAGLRAFVSKIDLGEFCKAEKPDVLCLQETKLSDWKDCDNYGAVEGYTFVDSISTAKKGYSGTRTYVRDGLSSDVANGFSFDVTDRDAHDDEGRAVTTTLPQLGDLTVVNTYVPNSGMNLERLDFRTENFDPMVRGYLKSLPSKSVIWTGDLNVAERDYDRFWGGNFKAMQKCPGFTPDERASFRQTLAECGMVDAFRHKYPTAARNGIYTFYSMRFNQRAKGNGWRLDYFVVSAALVARVVDCFPLPKYTQSDHLPLVLWLRR